MAKKKTSYKCGHCGESGHNARTCPNKGDQKAPHADTESQSAVPSTEEKKEKEKKEKKEKRKKPAAVPSDPTVDLLDTDRTRPPRPAGPGCFQCPKCNRASILVLVQLPENQGGTKEMRCEMCHNKTPISQILLWGAQPTDVPATR